LRLAHGTVAIVRANIGRALTPTEEATHGAKVEALQREPEADEARRRAEAASKAAMIWKAVQPVTDDHAYLRRIRFRNQTSLPHLSLLLPLPEKYIPQREYSMPSVFLNRRS